MGYLIMLSVLKCLWLRVAMNIDVLPSYAKHDWLDNDNNVNQVPSAGSSEPVCASVCIMVTSCS